MRAVPTATLADAGAGSSGWEQVGQHGAADVAGEVDAVGDDVLAAHQEVLGGGQGGGEAGPVRVGARDGLHGGDHGPTQALVEGQQGPQLLFEAGWVGRAQHPALEQGVPQREVGQFVFPPLVIQLDQRSRGVAAVIVEAGGQPVGGGVSGAVGAGDGDVGADDPHDVSAEARQERAVLEARQHRQATVAAQPDQVVGAGGGELGEEVGGVEAAVGQHQHVRPEQPEKPACVVGLPDRGRAEHRAQQCAGAGLDQGHQLHRRVAGDAERGAQFAQPGPVALAVGDLDRGAAVEGDRAEAPEPHSRSAWPGHRPGQHLEQRLDRGGAQAATQIPQRLVRRARHAQPPQAGDQLAPHLAVAQGGKQAQRQHEVHPDPRRQLPQPLLGGPGLLEHRVHQLERDLLGQLPEMTRGEHLRRHRARRGDLRGPGPGRGHRAPRTTRTGPCPGGLGHGSIRHCGSLAEDWILVDRSTPRSRAHSYVMTRPSSPACRA